MSTDHNSGMPPVDTFAVDPGAFVSESSFPIGSEPLIAGDNVHSTESPVGVWDTGLAPKSALGAKPPTRASDFVNEQGTGAMEFRVIRSGLPIRRLRLTGNRYTFGSAEGCSIQLNDPALRPMHAVLIRDASRILVRAYSVPIELNDTRTTEASLHTGDVVRLGAYSFELLSTSAKEFDRIGSLSAPNALSAPLSDNSEAWREQLRREVEQWRERQAECDRREGRCADREADLRGRESELWTRAEQLHRRESSLMSQESAALQIQDDYARQQQELVRLRDENRAKQQAFAERETEFQSLEQEYRQHVDEASRQLLRSQQQAEAATQAVQRMREQFTELNQQLEDLQSQQSKLQDREQQQREEHDRLRHELETERDEAISGKADADSHRQDIEKRIDEMESQIRQAQTECNAERQRADENESVASQLREQIEHLQENVRTASEEATQLRQDYEQACGSVRSLEAMIEHGNSRGEMDRESWYGEAEELRQSVEQLSIDLARANGEVSDLREANQSLTRQIDQLTQERDKTRDELHSRPNQEVFQSLREELAGVNEKLAEMQHEYEETLNRLEAANQETEAAQQRASDAEAWAVDSDARVADSESRVADSESRVADSEARVAESEARVADWETRVAEAEARLADTEARLQAAEALADEKPTEEESSSRLGIAGEVAAGAVSWAASDHDSRTDDEADSSELAQEPENKVEASEVEINEVEHDEFADQDATDSPAGDLSGTQEELVDQHQGWPRYQSEPESATADLADEVPQDDDSPRWSAEPKQKTDAPHFETGEDEVWSESGNDPPNVESNEDFTAEFDRTADTDPPKDDYSSANESVDNVIDEIEKNVDNAIAADVVDEVETEPTDTESADTYEPNASDEPSTDETSSESRSSESSTSDSSPWGHDSDDAKSETQPDAADVTSPWNSESAFRDASDELVSNQDDAWSETTSPSSETPDHLVNQWRPIDKDQEEIGDDNEPDVDHESQSESLGLADQLIQDIDSLPEESDVDSDEKPADENTYQWDKTQPFSSQDDAPSHPEFGSSHKSWDEEYPEEARSSEWTNDVDGDHTELIKDSSGESAIDTPPGEPKSHLLDQAEDVSIDPTDNESAFVESEDDAESDHSSDTEEDAVAESSDPEPVAEEDDSIEAYMNRLLQRVQGEPGGDTTLSVSKPLVASDKPTVEKASETAAVTTNTSASTQPIEPDAPLVPRSQAPERNSDLSAMRELANDSARTAVARSVRIQARDTQIKAMMKFAQAGVAGLCAAACFTFLDWTFFVKLLVVGAILVIAGILVQEGLVLMIEAKRRLNVAEHGGNVKSKKDVKVLGSAKADVITHDSAESDDTDEPTPIG